MSHKADAVKKGQSEGCLECGWAARRSYEDFCGDKCRNVAHSRSPALIHIPKSDKLFRNIADQFQNTWTHPGTVPEVYRVYRIICGASEPAYLLYRAKVEQKGNFVNQGMFPGNERRRWHGTVRKCTLGDDGTGSLCYDSECHMCIIIRNSFDKDKSKDGMFGQGIYSSATSSKSGTTYTKQGSPSPYNAILFNSVVLGAPYFGKRPRQGISSPPLGKCDSIVANPSDVLGYDEAVVYDNNAIRPRYLVLYA